MVGIETGPTMTETFSGAAAAAGVAFGFNV